MTIGITEFSPAPEPKLNSGSIHTINLLEEVINSHHLYFKQRWELFLELESINQEVMDDIVQFWTNQLNDPFKIKRAKIVLRRIEKQLNPKITDEEAMNIIMAIHL